MSATATASPYKKDYTPGYTGHVPSKMERFGNTSGQIKREILADRGIHPCILDKSKIPDRSNRLYCSSFVPSIDKNKIVHGNMSRFAQNWNCGPNHMIRPQQIPGYTGHVKGLISENLFSDSYGSSTSKAIGKKHPIGHNVVPK